MSNSFVLVRTFVNDKALLVVINRPDIAWWLVSHHAAAVLQFDDETFACCAEPYVNSSVRMIPAT